MIPFMLPVYEDLQTYRWWRIVLPVGRRRLGALEADPMLLWTFQSEAAYRVLAETGVHQGDPTRANPDLGFVYPWMQRQADSRLTTTGNGLLWLWATTTRRGLIDQAKHAPGDVLLTVQLPRDHVLLSDFGDWHVPLNSGIHVPPKLGEDDETWWARTEPVIDDWHDRPAHRLNGGEDPGRSSTRAAASLSDAAASALGGQPTESISRR